MPILPFPPSLSTPHSSQEKLSSCVRGCSACDQCPHTTLLSSPPPAILAHRRCWGLRNGRGKRKRERERMRLRRKWRRKGGEGGGKRGGRRGKGGGLEKAGRGKYSHFYFSSLTFFLLLTFLPFPFLSN